MDREKTAVFIGHRDCELSVEDVIPRIEEAISAGITTFLNGGMGQFDRLCAFAVRQLKATHPQIRHILVKPYPKLKVSYEEIFDDSCLYADEWHIQDVGPRRAIPQRNAYMVEHSSVAICFVEHTSSGSFKTYLLAKQNGLTIIDV